jgi:hypothetical protein
MFPDDFLHSGIARVKENIAFSLHKEERSLLSGAIH